MLCFNDGAATIHKVETYPLDVPKAKRMRKTRTSELIRGDPELSVSRLSSSGEERSS